MLTKTEVGISEGKAGGRRHWINQRQDRVRLGKAFLGKIKLSKECPSIKKSLKKIAQLVKNTESRLTMFL